MPPSVISADGYFTGDRQKRLSRTARLMFPSFFLASDGNARLELNPVRIIGRAFADFIPPVSEDEVIACIKEYAAVGLLFLYEHDGRAYGQWDTQTQWLP